MNSVNLIGRLARDPEVRYSGDLAIARFTLAVSRQKKDDGADFISCKAFGKTAELIAKYMHKGSQLGVSGHINTGSYEKEGRTVYTTDVIVDRMDFVGSRSDSAQQTSAPMDEPPAGFAALDDLVPF